MNERQMNEPQSPGCGKGYPGMRAEAVMHTPTPDLAVHKAQKSQRSEA